MLTAVRQKFYHHSEFAVPVVSGREMESPPLSAKFSSLSQTQTVLSGWPQKILV